MIKQYSKHGDPDGVYEAKLQVQVYELLHSADFSHESIFNPLIYSAQDPSCIWLCFNLPKKTLADRLFTIKQIYIRKQDIFSVKHQMFYKLLNEGKEIIKTLVKSVARSLKRLEQKKLVHSKICSDNLYLIFNEDLTALEKVLLKDFRQCYSSDTEEKTFI